MNRRTIFYIVGIVVSAYFCRVIFMRARLLLVSGNSLLAIYEKHRDAALMIFSDMAAYNNESNYCNISGTLYNKSDKAIKTITLTFQCFDAKGNALPYWPHYLDFMFTVNCPPHTSTTFTTIPKDTVGRNGATTTSSDGKVRLKDVSSIQVQVADIGFQ